MPRLIQNGNLIDGDRQSFGTIFNNGEQFDIVVRWLDGVNLSISPVEVYDGENFVLYWDSVEPPPDEAKNEIWSYKYSPSPNKNNKKIFYPKKLNIRLSSFQITIISTKIIKICLIGR